MEMGSGSLTESNDKNGSPEPLYGLKFGEKVYFENAPSGSRIKSSGSSSSVSPSSGSARKVHGGQQPPPRCQVEGCKVDLSDAKAYHSRHKVCGMHSKSPKVVVAGLEQRFCQQCSRFHQLSEFDQGKRSCRRRLAGHNERRRKSHTGSLLSSRYSRLSTIALVTDNSSRAGGLLDFSAYSRFSRRDAWPSERAPGNQTTSTRSISGPCRPSSRTLPSNLYLQGSSSETGFSSFGFPPGECFSRASITDSTCALSLLSNQPWGSGFNLVNAQEAALAQSTFPHSAAANQYPNPSWGFKGREATVSSHEMCPDQAFSHILHPPAGHFSGQLDLSQQNMGQYVELDHSRAYDSSNQDMNWTL